MKLNNKGFAITAVLYGLLILFVILVSSYLTIMSARKNRVDNLVKDMEEEYLDNYVSNNTNTGDNTGNEPGNNGGDTPIEEPGDEPSQEIILYKVNLTGLGNHKVNTLYFSPEEKKYYSDSEGTNEVTRIQIPTLSISGYTFQGYFTENEGTGKPIIDERGTITSFNIPSDDYTLYSYWIKSSGSGDVGA